MFGRSLGGAVAVSLAHKFPAKVSALILENTFLSVSAMVDVLLPYVRLLKDLVLRIGWNNDRLIGDLQQPIFFISGDSDQLVPPAHMSELFRLAARSAGKELWSVPGGGHNDTWEVLGLTYYRVSPFLSLHCILS